MKTSSHFEAKERQGGVHVSGTKQQEERQL
jgi:hypothetical protein